MIHAITEKSVYLNNSKVKVIKSQTNLVLCYQKRGRGICERGGKNYYLRSMSTLWNVCQQKRFCPFQIMSCVFVF